VGWRELHQTDERERTLLTLLAEHVAVALANAQLQDKAETRAGAVERQYRALFNGVADAILVTDAQGRYVDANAAATELLGYTRDELLRMRVAELVAASPEGPAAECAHLADQGSWRGEVALRAKDGRVVPVEVRARGVALPSGTVNVAVVRELADPQASATPPAPASLGTGQRRRTASRAPRQRHARTRRTGRGRAARKAQRSLVGGERGQRGEIGRL
jgi:PAS domain S-box-containing protein